ncbi:MAG: hypothetical protein ACRC53_07640 [Plesiomonas sp.]|uniref:hypothetical protein n=1 Tax=Plesiomonas sp. TaxID=2486279 RepID=UPI003F3BA822
MKAVILVLSLMSGIFSGAVLAANEPVTQTQAQLAPKNYLVQLCVATFPGATNLSDCSIHNGK